MWETTNSEWGRIDRTKVPVDVGYCLDSFIKGNRLLVSTSGTTIGRAGAALVVSIADGQGTGGNAVTLARA